MLQTPVEGKHTGGTALVFEVMGDVLSQMLGISCHQSHTAREAPVHVNVLVQIYAFTQARWWNRVSALFTSCK